MHEMTIEEVKKTELDILSDVTSFCDNNKIEYFLAYGTLIGAVRHKGFIPWDDDIDIWMPRKDYDKFKTLYNEKNKGGIYFSVCPEDKISKHSFVKVINTSTAKLESGFSYENGYLGVDIDIFPLDGQPDDDAEFLQWFKKLFKHYKLFSFLNLDTSKSFKRKIANIVFSVMSGGKKNLLKKTASLHAKYPYNECKYIGTVESMYNRENQRYKKEWFAKSVLMDFEGKKFKAPIGYDEILIQTYGDYMKLPPKEEQVTHHVNNAYWL